MNERTLFVAGSTGAVGRTVMRLAPELGARAIPHLRPSTAKKLAQLPSNAAVVDLADTEGLAMKLGGATTVLQLIGTIRKRFAQGDTYESSDIGTTRQLVEAARKAGTIDHLVLLSSVGAGKPVGAYLKAKAEAERIVRESGIPYTIFRPSAFVGEGHAPPKLFGLVTEGLKLDRYRPIAVEALARAILRAALRRAPLGVVLEGSSLWELVEAVS